MVFVIFLQQLPVFYPCVLLVFYLSSSLPPNPFSLPSNLLLYLFLWYIYNVVYLIVCFYLYCTVLYFVLYLYCIVFWMYVFTTFCICLCIFICIVKFCILHLCLHNVVYLHLRPVASQQIRSQASADLWPHARPLPLMHLQCCVFDCVFLFVL